MIAKKRGIPADLVMSPGQVELEMKKLAILREVSPTLLLHFYSKSNENLDYTRDITSKH